MKIKISLVLLLFLIQPLFGDHHNEGDSPSDTVGFSPAFAVSSILDFGDFDLHTFIAAEFNSESPHVYEFQALLYYRVFRNLKAGVFYRLQMGQRHDDDWIRNDDGSWGWDDASSRLENIAGADLTPRFLLSFMPGKSWVLKTKVRYSYSFYNRNQKVLFRPELTWFLMKNRKPVWNFSAAYGLYFPLNFSDSLIYEHGPYLTISRHIGDSLILSLFGEYRTRYWSSSAEYIAAGGDYHVHEERYRAGLNLIWRTRI